MTDATKSNIIVKVYTVDGQYIDFMQFSRSGQRQRFSFGDEIFELEVFNNE